MANIDYYDHIKNNSKDIRDDLDIKNIAGLLPPL